VTKVTDSNKTQTRQADAIDITHEMIEAGVDAYWDVDVENVGSRELVRRILIASISKSKRHLNELITA
jgi:hypothetical protein